MEKSLLFKISAALLLTIILAGCGGVGTKYVSFAQCLTQKGVKMYGAYWCPHCSEQKEMFGLGFKEVTYVECDPKGSSPNPQECAAKNVRGFPTWIFGDGSRLEGTQQLATLAEKTSCTLPEEK